MFIEGQRKSLSLSSIAELYTITVNENSFTVGANVSLTELMETLQVAAAKYDFYSYGKRLADHIDLVATVPVRNVKVFIDSPFRTASI